MKAENDCLYQPVAGCARSKEIIELVVKGQEVLGKKNLSLEELVSLLMDAKKNTSPDVKALKQDVTSVAFTTCVNCVLRKLLLPKV